MNARHLAMIGMLIVSIGAVEARTWTDSASGRTLEGDLLRVEGENALIRRANGTVVTVAVAKLSDSDKELIANEQKAKEESEAAAARPEPTHKKGEKLKVGDVIDISFRAVNGGNVDLAEMKDKVVLLDFWATWCGPCIAEIPNVKKAYAKYHDKGFEIVGISLDSSKSSLEDYIKKNEMPWPQYFDGKGWDSELGRQFGVSSIPAVFLVKNSEVIATGVRGTALEEQLKKLLD